MLWLTFFTVLFKLLNTVIKLFKFFYIDYFSIVKALFCI